jgi:hypothetical protein
MVLSYLIDAVRVLAMLAVLVLALVLRRRLGGTASALAAVGGGLLALIAIFDAWWGKFGIRLVYEGSIDQPMTVVALVSTAGSLVFLLGLGLVAAAVFVGRRDHVATGQPGPGQPYPAGQPYQPGHPGGGPTSGYPQRPSDPTA